MSQPFAIPFDKELPEDCLTELEYSVYEVLADEPQDLESLTKNFIELSKINGDTVISPELIPTFIQKQLDSILEKGFCYESRPGYYCSN